MMRTLFGLLWLLSIGSTERSVDNGVVFAVFSWIDGHREQNNNISLEEYNQTWTSCDNNSDSYLSTEEVREAIQQLQAGSNSYLEDMFGNQNYSYQNPFESQFKKIDNSSDGFVSPSEFESYCAAFVHILDALDSASAAIRGGRNMFS